MYNTKYANLGKLRDADKCQEGMLDHQIHTLH